ncbi:hypothetical protein BB560_006597 [Smittium megazygosporum]|uniref:ribose-phosphate diphosphokinase n=1 Tax=Smittium megazygosporum TaxID=133381 RepID=A0A2T9Y3A9_9FUNG|nr:hypothetical protein BB560_006597 [Smittium megazygosporum]
MRNVALLSGSSHNFLSRGIADYLGVELVSVKLGKFSNQESSVEINTSIRNKHVYIIQSSCGNVNDAYIELLIMIQACRMGSASKISVVAPLFFYSRQHSVVQAIDSLSKDQLLKVDIDSKYKKWCPRIGTLICSLIESAGADHLIVMDLHDPQYEGFFEIPVDVVYSEPCILSYIKTNIPDWKNSVVVSPDAGVASVCNKLNLSFALIHNQRSGSISSMGLVGDVSGKSVILIDDIIDSGKTVAAAVRILQNHGVKDIHFIAIHGIFSGNCLDIINSLKISSIACTNSVPQEDHLAKCPNLFVIDTSAIIGETIRRSFHGESVAHLFVSDKS